MDYMAQLDRILEQLNKGDKPKLLLHCCCAPCSSHVIECLAGSFEIVCYFYNPNIYPFREYLARLREMKKLLREMPCAHSVTLVEEEYDDQNFRKHIRGLEEEREGGARCEVCFKLRMRKTAEYAKLKGFGYFCTTLTTGPHKDAGLINEIGNSLALETGVAFLPCDFKKRDGYKRSVELCRQFDIYRQTYCGCEYSLN